jgi:hypothetical protein
MLVALRGGRAGLRAELARRPAATAAVAGAVVVAFVLLRLLFATSLGGFVVASDDFVNPGGTPDALPVVTDTGGYDGQFVYRLAVDPWTALAVEHGVELDNPAYRQQRIATPVLAWTLGLLPGVAIPLALVLVNAAALVVAAWYASRLAAGVGRHPAWGLVLAFPACMPISLGRDLTEPVAWAGVLAGIWYARNRRWPAAAVALTVAVLARETSLVVVAGLLAGEAARSYRATRRPAAIPSLSAPATAAPGGPPTAVPALAAAAPGGSLIPPGAPAIAAPGGSPIAGPASATAVPGGSLIPPGASAAASAGGQLTRDGVPAAAAAAGAAAAWLSVPLVAGVAWQLILWQVWASVPLRSGGSGSLGGLPLLGVFGSMFADLPDFTNEVVANPAVGAVVFVERFALLALFCVAGLALLRRRAGMSAGEAVAWALAVGLALSLRAWRTDVQFLRAANEAVGLSLLVALGDPTRAGRLARWLGAALVLGVALEYAVRQ